MRGPFHAGTCRIEAEFDAPPALGDAAPVHAEAAAAESHAGSGSAAAAAAGSAGSGAATEGAGAGRAPEVVPDDGAAALEELARRPPGLLLLVPLMLGLQKVSALHALCSSYLYCPGMRDDVGYLCCQGPACTGPLKNLMGSAAWVGRCKTAWASVCSRLSLLVLRAAELHLQGMGCMRS